MSREEATRVAFASGARFCSSPRNCLSPSEALRALGFVQLDTISVVRRAHEHILWSRSPGAGDEAFSIMEGWTKGRYDPSRRRTIEYWAHAAAYIPIEDYRYSLPRMARVREKGRTWFDVDPRVLDFVRDRIRAEGPLMSKDFSEPITGPRGWWGWKPAKIALEYLFHVGELVSTTRKGFQKVYDLAERVLPRDLDMGFPSERKMAEWYVDRAIVEMGVFSPSELGYLRKEGKGGIRSVLDERVSTGRLLAFDCEAFAGGVCYCAPEALEPALPSRGKPEAFILSPFDPLIIQRKRASHLLGYDGTLECYAPASKRVFGYFVLPILFRDTQGNFSFRGKLDAKALRQERRLRVNRLGLDIPEGRAKGPFLKSVATAIGHYAAFNGCEGLELGELEAKGCSATDFSALLPEK